MSFSIKKDGVFSSVVSNTLSTTPTNAEKIVGMESQIIAAGTYDIGFLPSPWAGGTTFVSDVRYLCISGTQLVEVTGHVTMDSTSTPGTIGFSMPFPTGTQIIGGASSCYTSPTSPVPSICTCSNGEVSLYVALSAPTTRLDFMVHVMAPIFRG